MQIRFLLLGLTLFFHFIVPFLLLYSLYTNRKTKLYWMGIFGVTASYLLFISKAGAGWSWFGYYWPYIFGLFFILVAIVSAAKQTNLPWLPPKIIYPWAGITALLLITLLIISGLPSAFTARSFPRHKAISLVFPLDEGIFFVSHGGSNEVMNHHYHVPAQRYALDILALNRWGVRASGLMPENPHQYTIFGNEVTSPCSGKILASETNLPDQNIPEMDPENLLGELLNSLLS